MNRIEVNVETGETTIVPYTAEEIAAIAAQHPEPPQPYELFKTTIYERMTDAELDKFEPAMLAAPRRQRLMWQDCISVRSDSEYFPQLQAAMEAVFTKPRAAQILARP